MPTLAGAVAYQQSEAALDEQERTLLSLAREPARLLAVAEPRQRVRAEALLRGWLQVAGSDSRLAGHGTVLIAFRDGHGGWRWSEAGASGPDPAPTTAWMQAALLRALDGRSGSLQTANADGPPLLAVYTLLAGPEAVVVAMAPVEGVPAPYLAGGLVAGGVLLACLLLIAVPMLHTITPLQRHMAERDDFSRSVLESAVDGIICIDAAGIVLSVNPAAERLFGYSAAEVVGRNVNMLMPSPDREQHDGYLRNYLRTGHKRIIGIGREVRGQRKDGSKFPLLLGVSEVRAGGNRFFTGIIHDLTERERLEGQLRSAQALTALGMIARGVAHHFNNRLQVIRSYVEIIEHQTSADTPTGRAVSHILRTLEQSTVLTRHLLTFRAQPGGAAQAVDLEPLLHSLAILLTPALSSQLLLQVRPDPSVPPAWAEPLALRNALLQVCLYAGTAGPDGGNLNLGTGCLQAAPQAGAAAGSVAITVHRSGLALTPEGLEQVFEAGSGAESGNEQEQLGLAIANVLIRRMAGTLTVRCEQGEGTTFVIALPTSPAQTREPPAAAEAPSASAV